jgi:hypothetical protein
MRQLRMTRPGFGRVLRLDGRFQRLRIGRGLRVNEVTGRRRREGPDRAEFLGILVRGEETGGEEKVAGVGKWSDVFGGEEVHGKKKRVCGVKGFEER